tara:strand:- start:1238 stop:1621 length:384 start_codon:yes stop_codon:yes gene_type:complete
MSETRMNGRVKWFDSKKGYGFISTTGESTQDLFVHFSNIQTSNESVYKKLFPGEYVSFQKVHDEDNDRYQCIDVRGIDNGPLMTENTEYRFKVFKNYNYTTDPEIAEVLDDSNHEDDDNDDDDDNDE